MRHRCLATCRGHLVALIVLLGSDALATGHAANAQGLPGTSPTLDSVMADYRRKLAEHTLAREKYEEQAEAYWGAIREKRKLRNAKRRSHQAIVADDYVLTQPPVYAGPPRPVDPSAPPEEKIPQPEKFMPVVADFLLSAAAHFQFVPEMPETEIQYKRAYAAAAAAAGLTRDQVVRIYGFEAGGNGRYDVQAGLEYARPGARAISTALGYNQLLNTNSVELMAEQGDTFIKALKQRAERLPEQPRQALHGKIAMLQRMVKFSKTVPDEWSAHERLANTPQGLGVHAMNLDIDVGPLLQVQKLINSIAFARKKGFEGALTAAELEMMNLTGDGNGFDMITLPAAMRERIPTANFFQRSGYERNPVAIRNNVVAKLLAATDARMDKEILLQGAKDLAAAF